MPFWKCYYHISWATKHRQPVIVPAWEPIIFAAIKEKAAELRSDILAINAAFDHIHVAAAIPPAKAVGDWVGKVKGVSSHAVNTSFELDEPFRWQEGYGVMTFGEKRLAQVTAYIATQKERHENHDLNSYLERSDE